MLERFLNLLEELSCLKGRTVLLAVSGGVDSMCLAELFFRSGRPFEVLHCHFGLRGADSDADCALVSDWCRDRGIPCHVKQFDTIRYASAQGISIEMAARDLRYAWFDQESRARGGAVVAVAHHADDNAETLILNLLRGTGLDGIRGMRPVRSLPGGGFLIRPLLEFSREEIESWAAENKVPFREDKSNADTAFLRNRIRHEVMPVFRSINPSFLQTISRDMAHFDDAAVAAEAWYRSQRDLHSQEGRIGFDVLRSEGGSYLLYCFLKEHGFPASVAEQIGDMLSAGRPTAGHSWKSKGYRIALTSSELLFEPLSAPSQDAWTIPAPGVYDCGGVSVEVTLEYHTSASVIRCPEGESVFDAEVVCFPLPLRRWRAGDWLEPIGLGGRKKVSDIFTDLHSNLFEKEKALVLAGEGSHVFSLLGHRTDESVKVTDRTEILLHIRIR